MFLSKVFRRKRRERGEKMGGMTVMNDGLVGGVTKDAELDLVVERLAFVTRVSEYGMEQGVIPCTQVTMTEATTDMWFELLESALERENLEALFPAQLMLENGLTNGIPRLRNEGNGHWAQVVIGKTEGLMEEVYNYLQLVRLPKMAFQFLSAMKTDSKIVLAALKSEQREEYDKAGILARKVLKTALDILGQNYAEVLFKIDFPVLQESLIPPKR